MVVAHQRLDRADRSPPPPRPTRCQTNAVTRVDAPPRHRSARGDTGTPCAAPQASVAVRDGRLWRRRTVHQRQCRGVQPADQVWIAPATSVSIGTERSFPPLPNTRTQRRAISTSATRSESTSADRRPDNSINPPIARSRQLRKLPSSADSSRDNPRGNRRGSRTRSCDRDFGFAVCANSPERSLRERNRAARPLPTGLRASGSRISRNVNKLEIAANRRLIVAGAYPDCGHHGSNTRCRPADPATSPPDTPSRTAAAHQHSPPTGPTARQSATARTPAGHRRKPGRFEGRNCRSARYPRNSLSSPQFSAAVPRNCQTPSSSTAADSSFVMRCTYPISHYRSQEPQENGVSSTFEHPD